MMNREGTAHHRSAALPLGIVGFFILSVSLWLVARYFDVTIGGWTAASILLVLAPYWAFGFGFDRWLRRTLKSPAAATLAPSVLIVPYLIFALPQGLFRWSMCLGMMAIILAIAILLRQANTSPNWRDWLVLAILGISVDLHFFDRAWPVAGLSGIPKLLFVDAGLYGYLVIRPIGNIGFDFRIRRRTYSPACASSSTSPQSHSSSVSCWDFCICIPPLVIRCIRGGMAIHVLLRRDARGVVLPRFDAEPAGAARRPATRADHHIAVIRARAFQQTCGVLQLEIRHHRRCRRHLLRTRLARGAKADRFVDHPRDG